MNPGYSDQDIRSHFERAVQLQQNNQLNDAERTIENHKREFERQTQELQSLYKENEELKMSINTKKILKKKDDTF